MNKFLQNLPKLRKVMFLMCLVLIWGLSFPFELEYGKPYLLIGAFVVVGAGLISLFGINKEKFVYITSLISTGIGMIFRYFLEYGEVSNTKNFTAFNILSYLVVVPIFTIVSYHYFAKSILKRNNS